MKHKSPGYVEGQVCCEQLILYQNLCHLKTGQLNDRTVDEMSTAVILPHGEQKE
jgi:hypothetical protein